MSDSTISGNSAQQGGGIFSRVSTVTLTSSTVNGNSAQQGGGIFSNESTVTLINSTISGNSATNRGGGIYCYRGGFLTATYSTITSNESYLRAFYSSGGGIYVQDSSVAELDHTIVAGNVEPYFFFPRADDIHGSVSARSSLIGYSYDATITDNGGNLIGTFASLIDPLLGPLTDNGGSTFTHALLAGSPAIDAGDPDLVAGIDDVPKFDQRGMSWSRVVGGRIDIGAVESQPNPLPGDANFNGIVDDNDYALWKTRLRLD